MGSRRLAADGPVPTREPGAAWASLSSVGAVSVGVDECRGLRARMRRHATRSLPRLCDGPPCTPPPACILRASMYAPLQLTRGPCVAQIWSRYARSFEQTKRECRGLRARMRRDAPRALPRLCDGPPCTPLIHVLSAVVFGPECSWVGLLFLSPHAESAV